jgi:hypothetical protein
MRGPHQPQHVVYLLNPVTMAMSRYPTGTVMKTRWGGRQRPQLRPVRWITLDEGGDLPGARPPKLVSPGIAGTLDQFAERSQQTSLEKPQTGTQTVEPPNLKEEIDDDILF